ncbi:TIR domain-containing protein [Phormidesmis sp. 146-33]
MLPSNPSSQVNPDTIELFFSYSHRDEDLMKELVKHLSILKRQGIIQNWHDRQITAGSEWAGQIDEHLNAAHVILLLISPDFLASDYCYDIELTRAMERHESGTACVIPVILRPVDWQSAPFGKLQAVPKNARPVALWANQDEAFQDIARSIRQVVEAMAKQGHQTQRRVQAELETRTYLTHRISQQQRRIQQEIESLQQMYDLLSEKLHRLRTDLATQAGSAIAFQLEKEIDRAEAERTNTEQRLRELESQL